jgi:hypothetical protein
MRLFMYRTGPRNPGFCFAFRVDARRIMDGSGVETYGSPMWVKPDISGTGSADEFMVIDLPLNTAPGLGYPNDLAAAQFLAFEFNTVSPPEEGGLYQLLGVEMFESTTALPLFGASVYGTEEEAACSSFPAG